MGLFKNKKHSALKHKDNKHQHGVDHNVHHTDKEEDSEDEE